MNFKNKKGFTLSEVLIVLGIIGVIASLTIPGLVQEIQNAQLKTAWKNDYGMLEGATRRVLLDAGGNFNGYFLNQDDLANKCLQYLTYTKKCNSGTSNGNCWHNLGSWKFLNGQPGGGLNSMSGSILNNGSLMWIWLADSTCTSTLYGCGLIAVDVNGWSGPNTVGKDIYRVTILKKSLVPDGAIGSNVLESTCASTGNGWGCSSKYLHE